MSRILVTGAFGQIGSELVPALQEKFGISTVIAVDKVTAPVNFQGTAISVQLPDKAALEAIIQEYKIDTIYHLVSLLSATGEANPDLAWTVNLQSLKDVLDLAKEYSLKVFWPSSIAAFGPTTPRENTPQDTIIEPTTMYGITKRAGELLCQYYAQKYNLDVRSIRYPGLISWKTAPGGGTTDYAVAMFTEGIARGAYTCFVRPDTVLPMMYMDDAIRATLQIMDAPRDSITIHTSYNLAAMSFRADELAAKIQEHIPVEVAYQPDHRQAIADSWPASIDDTVAQQDWGWQPEYDLDALVQEMLTHLKK